METPVEVDVRHGTRLEALLALPESPSAGLVVCHPHPLYGGDMHNPVVVRASEVAQGLGLATLRFNFRGVGASTGVHDEGKGEQDDVLAALDMLAARLPAGRQLGLAGYSFGSWVSARVVAAGRDLPASSSACHCIRCSSRAIATPFARWKQSNGWESGSIDPWRSSRARSTSSWASSSRSAGWWTDGSGGGPARAPDQSRSRGSRAGVAVPAERMMRMPSSTVSPVEMTSCRGTMMTSPR